ncbi:MAG: hypothetical protein OEY66_07140 [Gammaproteobacteria bacterium]|nr:hypothetical protein [Gammaproteobacteria bacterium]
MKNNLLTLGQKDRSLILPSVLGKGFFYGMYAGNTSIVDKFGLAADIGKTGVTGDVSTNAGWFTGNGADHYESLTDTHMHDVLSLGLTEQLILTFDLFLAAGWAANDAAMSYGRYTSTVGGFVAMVLSTNRVRFDYRAVGGSQLSVATSAVMANDVRHTVTFDVNVGAGTVDTYVDGAVSGGASGVAFGTPVTNEQTGGLFIAARMGASAADSQMDATGRMANLLAFKPAVVDTSLALAINTEMYNQRHEIPWAIEGK